MRNQWRLLLRLRHHSRPQPHISRDFPQSQVHPFLRSPSHPISLRSPSLRLFSSSEQAAEKKTDPSDQTVVLTYIFSKTQRNNEEIKLDLESNNVVITHDLVLSALKNLKTSPDVARRLFDFVLERDSQRLSSKSYNLMLGILGFNGFSKEFWEMVESMKKKGYGVSKGTYDRVLPKFKEIGCHEDAEKLMALYDSGAANSSDARACSRIFKVIRQNVWGDDVEKSLRELPVEFSSDLVVMVLDNLETEINKGLIFFRWIEESGVFKHDERSYNAMARLLAGDDSSEKFWRIVNEMRTAGHELETATYVQVLQHFIKKKMMKDAVDLYEFAMLGANKPSVHDCTFLLKKIVVCKELDMDLFSRVVSIFTGSGNTLIDAILDAVLKSLTSVGRLGEWKNILNAMEAVGFHPNYSRSNIGTELGRNGQAVDFGEFTKYMEAPGSISNYTTWASFVEGYLKARDLDKASDTFQKMVEREGVSQAGYALDILVSKYCRKKRAVDAFKLVSAMVNEKELQPWHTTYKTLTSSLLAQRNFIEALDVLSLMKNQGYPPYMDPFVKFLSKKGTAEDALNFSKSMTVKKFPSTSVFMRLFEAYFREDRQSEAQDFLSKCPKHIKNHADVLTLFFSMNSGKRAAGTAVTA